jgi:selenophosphate synthetase-related protein
VHWLLCYQGCGFVLTCRPEDADEVVRGLGSRGLEAASIGQVTEGHRLVLTAGGREETLFDFDREALTGCGPPDL